MAVRSISSAMKIQGVRVRTLGVVPFFMIISSSHRGKWVHFHDQSGTHWGDQKQSVALPQEEPSIILYDFKHERTLKNAVIKIAEGTYLVSDGWYILE